MAALISPLSPLAGRGIGGEGQSTPLQFAHADSGLTKRTQVKLDLQRPIGPGRTFGRIGGQIPVQVELLQLAANLPQVPNMEGISLPADGYQQGAIRAEENAGGRFLLSGIIDALLRLSRAGRLEYRWQQVDVDRMVWRILDAMQATLGERTVSVRVGKLPPAWGDPTALEQVFANLIGNAVNYADPGRPAKVEVDCQISEGAPEPVVTYLVKDNGLGIPEAYRQKVFQVFQRLPLLSTGCVQDQITLRLQGECRELADGVFIFHD